MKSLTDHVLKQENMVIILLHQIVEYRQQLKKRM